MEEASDVAADEATKFSVFLRITNALKSHEPDASLVALSWQQQDLANSVTRKLRHWYPEVGYDFAKWVNRDYRVEDASAGDELWHEVARNLLTVLGENQFWKADNQFAHVSADKPHLGVQSGQSAHPRISLEKHLRSLRESVESRELMLMSEERKMAVLREMDEIASLMRNQIATDEREGEGLNSIR